VSSRPRPTQLSITDVRSVWGDPLRVPLGRRLTVLVGPHRAGTSNVAWALAVALDPAERFLPARDLPRRGSGGAPAVALEFDDGTATTARFDPGNGQRSATGREPAGPVVRCTVADTPRDVLRRVADARHLDTDRLREDLAPTLRGTLRGVLPEVDAVAIDHRLAVRVRDDLGAQLAVPQVRALVAVGVARHLHRVGHAPSVTIIESPEAFLHPAAQERIGAVLLDLAADTGSPVVVTVTSPFVIPRTAETEVVALARDAVGCTKVVRRAAGDAPQARMLGGLLGDAGLATVLDRVARVPPGARGVLVVEGGTDEAYLRLAARRLGRDDVLDGLVIHAAGGAMAAALDALVLRAERDVPVAVLLDHDVMGRRARDTLVSRFGFNRATQVVTYADVVHGQPRGVEAETLFDLELVRRFVAEAGPTSTNGERWLDTVWHVDLTGSGKSAFVGWLEEHALPEQLAGWSDLLDVLASRFGA
jgi:5S rRNA maturation endonuclease (ribonuclease M5)